jgi:glyoxylase-like metal-dependent hydrolase (beta-lactamase superfamily II)
LLIVPLPGHTPGHVGLLVDAGTLLAGDASWPGDDLRVLQAHDPQLLSG